MASVLKERSTNIVVDSRRGQNIEERLGAGDRFVCLLKGNACALNLGCRGIGEPSELAQRSARLTNQRLGSQLLKERSSYSA
jgi:hypothetical protein